MPPYKASEAQFWFEVGGEPEDTFQVLDFYGAESISQLFRYEIKLIAPVDADLNLPDFLNKPAKLIVLRDGDKKEVHGILSDLEEVGRSKDFAQYHAVLVPRFWKLSLFYQSRVFQNQSVPDILKSVFKDAGFAANDFNLQLQRTYSPREYCSQYRETDLNFVSRLMEYEGMYYFFDHSGGTDVVVIVDDKGKNPKIESPDAIRSYVGEGVDIDEETISELTWHEKVVTGKVVLKDYNYRTPETNLLAESQIDGKSPGKYYEYGEHFKTASEGLALAKIRNEEIETARRAIVGASDCRGFHPGYKFTLNRHYRGPLNGDYLLTQVTHIGSQGGGIGVEGAAAGPASSYRNQFMCIPADVQYRPPRITPEPRIPGIMTAKVETAGGQYAYLDDEGRYRVKMPFDLTSTGQGKASRAVRLAQPYSGADYGMHFPILEGAEMVWACIDGNVDRPLGISSVPNPSRNSPVVATNKHQNILRTAGGNELIMDDKVGETQVSLKSTDAHNVLLDDKEDKIEVITTQKHVVTMDDKNQNITVKTTNGHLLVLDDANQNITVATTNNHRMVMDDKNTKIVLQSKNGHTFTIDDSSGGENITFVDKSGGNTFVIDITNKKLVIKTDQGSIDMQAPKGAIEIKAKTLKVETTADTSFKSANFKVNAQSGIDLKATADFKMKGMNVDAKADMNMKCNGGMNLELKAGMNAKLDGMMTDVNGATMTKVKGAIVMIN